MHTTSPQQENTKKLPPNRNQCVPSLSSFLSQSLQTASPHFFNASTNQPNNKNNLFRQNSIIQRSGPKCQAGSAKNHRFFRIFCIFSGPAPFSRPKTGLLFFFGVLIRKSWLLTPALPLEFIAFEANSIRKKGAPPQPRRAGAASRHGQPAIDYSPCSQNEQNQSKTPPRAAGPSNRSRSRRETSHRNCPRR